MNQLSVPITANRRMNKIRLLVTIRILLQILSKENRHLHMIAQKVLKDCHKFHHVYPEVAPLSELIEKGLRKAIDEKYWNKAKAIQCLECSVSLKSVCKKKNQSVFTVRQEDNEILIVMPLYTNKE